MKRILILGATGMAGHLISTYFIEKGFDVTVFSQKPFPIGKNIIGNALDREMLDSVVIEGEYDVVINTIGILNQMCDQYPDKAVYLNSYLPHHLCAITSQMKTKIIHVSTDCVFSGKNGPYYENSFKDGESFYDRTKALGEYSDNKNLVFRQSIIGPDMNRKGIGLFNWFMKQKGTISGYGSVMWTGVTTIVLAKAMEEAIVQNLSGLYNLVNNKSISKYDMLLEFRSALRKDININRNDDIKISKTLMNTRTDFCFEVPSYHEMINEMVEWIDKHKNLYTHYFI